MNTETIMQYEGLVADLSKRFYGVPKEDLIQAGFLGLLKAKRNFKPTSGVKFSSYAYDYIRGEMFETARKGNNVSLNKRAMRVYKSVKRAQALLEQKFARSVSIKETARYLKIDESYLADILNSLNQSLSIGSDGVDIPKRENLDDMILLRECLASLSDTEKKVIEARFMRDYSQMETAKVLGFSQVKVSRIEKRSREKMQKFMAS